jgi:hypothetical protein
MRALPWATGVTTGYQRDSSSKRPVSSVTLAARVPAPPVEAAAAMDAEEPAHSGLENDKPVFHSYHRQLDRRSFHIRLVTRQNINELWRAMASRVRSTFWYSTWKVSTTGSRTPSGGHAGARHRPHVGSTPAKKRLSISVSTHERWIYQLEPLVCLK